MLGIEHWLDAHAVFWPLFIFLARVADVSIGTVRTIMVVRGRRGIAAALGFCEVIIWVVAVSGVLRHDLTVVKVLAYGSGFAAGNMAGVWLEQWLAIGMQRVILISRGRHHSVAFGLRLAEYLVTEVPARGGRGEVAMCFLIVPRRQAPQVLRIARAIDPDVVIIVEDVRTTSLSRRGAAGHEATGWRAIVKKK
jgi:uncharacterized protein YebE (UPF0316 family)